MTPIPWKFIRDRVPFSWGDAKWGYHNNYIAWSDVIELAWDRLESGNSEAELIELAGLTKSEISQVSECLDKLSPGDDAANASQSKWLYLVLAWLFENKALFPDPLEVVESIYSDFNYPSEIASFVRYMPPSGDFDPSQHSTSYCLDRLENNWKLYLEKKASEYNATSSSRSSSAPHRCQP